jgi:nucleoside permease NupC
MNKKHEPKRSLVCRFGCHNNIFEAMSSGASGAVKVIANILANILAFISTLHMINSVLTWFGRRVGIQRLTFEVSHLLDLNIIHLIHRHKCISCELKFYLYSCCSQFH